MEFHIQEIGRSEEDVGRVFEVCKAAFGNVSQERLRSNWLDSHPSSTFLGAFHQGTLAAVNGFLAHPVMLKGHATLAYQSCWSATSVEHRGKGLFTKIINEAKQLLGGRCAFICGFPNEVSAPIFTGKLGFSSVPMVRNAILSRGPESLLQAQISVDHWFAALEDRNLVRFDQHAIAQWKAGEDANQFAIEHNTNFIWGRVGTRRLGGIPVKVLLAGGLELNKPQLFGRLMQEAAKATGVSIIRFVSAKGSVVGTASRWTRPGERTEPFIYFPIDNEVERLVFDAHTGMKDVY